MIKKIYAFSIMLVFLTFMSFSTQVTSSLHETLDTLFKTYQRPYTVLEICDNKPIVSFDFFKNKNATFVLMPKAGHKGILSMIEKQKHTNIVLLNPIKIDHALIERFGRCEYLDITIVHDLPEIKNFSEPYIKALLSLGNFLCVQADKPTIEKFSAYPGITLYAYNSNAKKPYCIIYTEKQGLDIARWNQKSKPTLKEPRYKVESDFVKKQMIKPTGTTEYVKGINLLTCIMLQGLYPTDAIIRENIAPLSTLKHEDLVVGNFVVQGKKLVPIDFNDLRRRGDAQRCVKAALSFFKHDKRFKDVRKALSAYEKKVQGKKKKKKIYFD